MPTDEELDPGFLTRHLSSPWASIPLALLSGFGAAATPGSARFTRGIHAGLGIGLGAEEGAYKREKEKRLSEALQGLVTPQAGAIPPNTSRPQVSGLTSAERAKRIMAIPDEEYQKMTSPQVQELLGESTVPRTSGTAQRIFDQLPDPAQYKGKAVRGTGSDAGQAYRSDGTRWIPVDPSAATQASSDPRAHLPPGMREYLRKIAPYDPEGASRVLGTYLTKEPSPHFATGASGEIIAIEPRTLKPTTIVPGTKPTTYEEAIKQIPGELPEGLSATVEFGRGGKVTKKGPEEGKIPPSMTEQQALAIEGKVNRGVPLNKRDLALLGTDDPEQAKAVVQEMRRIKKAAQVDTRTALAEALAAFKQTQMTGRESQIFRYNEETGVIEDAVTAGLPESDALKKGFRKLSTDDIKTIKRGEAALESLDDFEVSARRLLGKEPGIVNMTSQQLSTWFRQKQSDPDAVLFQTQFTRTLPLMIQSLGLSGARAGVRLLEIEKMALPNSGMTLGAALELLDRDRKTIRAVQKSVVSGTFGGKSGPGEAEPGKKETAEDVKRRLLGR